MTKLNGEQKQLLNDVRNAMNAVRPTLEKMEEEYDFAVYRAKGPVIAAINRARESKIPFSRIATEGLGLPYSSSAEKWLSPPEAAYEVALSVAQAHSKDEGTELKEKLDETMESALTVTRNSFDGMFTVNLADGEYRVPSFGPDGEAWSRYDASIPDDVYATIEEHYPGYVVLRDE